MQQTRFTIVPDANWASIYSNDGPSGTNKIDTFTDYNGFVYYTTLNTVRPASSVYAAMIFPNGSIIVSQSKLPAFVPTLSLLGWPIPA